MTTETVELYLGQPKTVWNRGVLFHDKDGAAQKAFIIAGNESNWLGVGQEIAYTSDFKIKLLEFEYFNDRVLLQITYGAVPPQITIATIISGMDNINEPQTRVFSVSGTGSGSYQVKEGNTVIATRNLVNGNDFFTLKNISYGSHTYCTVPAASTGCETFLIEGLLPPVRWSCSNNCVSVLQVGAYGSQAECRSACATPPPPPPPGTKWKCSGSPNYQCVQDAAGTYSTQAACQAACKAGGEDNMIWMIAAALIAGYLLLRKGK